MLKHKTIKLFLKQKRKINVLEWFKNSGYEFKYTSDAIDWASAKGHVNVLEWFKNSGFEFKYTDKPSVTKSMRIVLSDLKLDHLYVIYPGNISFELDEKITARGIRNLP